MASKFFDVVCHREMGEGSRSVYKTTETISENTAKQHHCVSTSPEARSSHALGKEISPLRDGARIASHHDPPFPIAVTGLTLMSGNAKRFPIRRRDNGGGSIELFRHTDAFIGQFGGSIPLVFSGIRASSYTSAA